MTLRWGFLLAASLFGCASSAARGSWSARGEFLGDLRYRVDIFQRGHDAPVQSIQVRNAVDLTKPNALWFEDLDADGTPELVVVGGLLATGERWLKVFRFDPSRSTFAFSHTTAPAR